MSSWSESPRFAADTRCDADQIVILQRSYISTHLDG
jgi:hypothetical protein